MSAPHTEVKQSEARVELFRPFTNSPNTECEFQWRPAPEDEALGCESIEIVELYMNGVPFLDKIRDTPHYNEADLKLLCLGHLLGINL